MSDSAKSVLTLLIPVAPFQLPGTAAYFLLAKSSVRNAHLAGGTLLHLVGGAIVYFIMYKRQA